MHNDKIMKIFCFITIFFFTACTSSLKVTEIKSGMRLESAVEKDVDFFFQCRMKNRIKKILGYNWEILYKDGSFVYFGYPKSMFSNEMKVQNLYKVKMEELQKDFPSFETVEGHHVQKAVSEAIHKDVKIESRILIQNIDWKPSLQKGFIHIDAVWKYQADSNPEVTKKYQMQLDMKSLKLISKKEI